MNLLKWPIFLLIVLLPAQSISQDLIANDEQVSGLTQNEHWQYGIIGGILFSTIEGDLTDDHSYIGDFSVGIYGSIQIFPPLGLMIELYYAGLGTGFASIGDSKLHLNYLVLPVMFTYEFQPKLSLGLGPYLGYLINAKDQGDDFEEDITDLISSLDVGVKIALYFQIVEAVSLGVSFNRGFINTQNGERVSSFKQYNQSIMFTTSINLTKILKHSPTH